MRLYFKIVLLCAVLLGFIGCSQPRSASFTRPYPIPPRLPANISRTVPDRYPLHIYWSQTLSERGYAQDRQGRINPPPEFQHFLTSLMDTFFRYAPQYNILQTRGRFVIWQPIGERDFAGTLNPTRQGFYNALGNGSFESGIGPLMMLYNENLIKADDLSIVITDLEEQGLNNIQLAASVRKLLAEEDSGVAAVIAVRLPFNGNNYKQNPNNRNQMISQIINDKKPLYVIVTGLRDPVALFVNAFRVNAERNNVQCYIVSTFFSPEVESISVSDVFIPQSATLADQSSVEKNKRVLADIWNIRNTSASGRIWNLHDTTRSSMYEIFGVREPLNLSIFEYRAMRGKANNGRYLWQLNVEFNIPNNLNLNDVQAFIENYNYMTQDTSEAMGPTEGKKKKNTAKSGAVPGKWETNDTFMRRDLEILATPKPIPDSNRARIYIVPRDIRNQSQQSSVLYFELVLRKPVNIPRWVEDFNDSDGGFTAGTTRGFYTFVEGILGLSPGEKAKASDEHELLRFPIVLTKIPASVRR